MVHIIKKLCKCVLAQLVRKSCDNSIFHQSEPQIGMGRYNKELKEAHNVNEKDGIYFGRMTSLNSSKNPAMHQ